ncbi:MAG: Membrane protein of unknown function [Pedosphaera sp.]|nr:Membrane protein of unknown function [Pedosphaera sp.]
MSPKLKQFLIRWANSAIGVVVATFVVRGINYHDKFLTLAVAAFLLGILNTFVRPTLKLLSLPLLIVTLGLFAFVINALLLYAVGWLMRPYFEVENFRAAFWGALVIWIVSGILSFLTGTNKARFTIRRGSPPPNRRDDGGGPVIDV